MQFYAIKVSYIPISRTPTQFSNLTKVTKRKIRGNRTHATDLSSMTRHTSWPMSRRTRSAKRAPRSVCAPIFLSFVSISESSLTDTSLGENHEALYRETMLYSSTVPTSPPSQIPHTVCPPRCCLQVECVAKREREEGSRTSACLPATVAPTSAILAALRNLVWDLTMRVVAR